MKTLERVLLGLFCNI